MSKREAEHLVSRTIVVVLLILAIIVGAGVYVSHVHSTSDGQFNELVEQPGG